MTTTQDLDRPLTYAEVEARLGISRATLRRIVARGELTIVIIGGRPRVLPRHLGEYLERQTREAVASP